MSFRTFLIVLAIAGAAVYFGLAELASTVQGESAAAADFGEYIAQRMTQCQETRYTFECIGERRTWIAEYRSR